MINEVALLLANTYYGTKPALEIGQMALQIVPREQIGKISDGYHTFDELYEHRITLFIALCRMQTEWDKMGIGCGPIVEEDAIPVWRTKVHSDGSVWDGWFILGINKESGEQITYHLPISKWGECDFAETLNKAPEWDGHTSADVLERLRQL